MKNKGIRTITAGVLAVSVVMIVQNCLIGLVSQFRGILTVRLLIKSTSCPNRIPTIGRLSGKPRSITTRWYVTIQLCTHRKLGTPRRVLVLSCWGFILRQ